MRTRLTPRSVVQNVSYTGTAGQSAAFAATTKVVRLVCTTNCFVKFGANPTATSSDLLLVANVPEFFGVDPGSKVSAVQVASGGTLSIAEGPV